MKLYILYFLCLLAVSALALPTSISNFTDSSLSTAVHTKDNARAQSFTSETSIDRTCLSRPTNGLLESLSSRAAITYWEEEVLPKPKPLTGQILDERRCFENGGNQYLREFPLFLAYPSVIRFSSLVHARIEHRCPLCRLGSRG